MERTGKLRIKLTDASSGEPAEGTVDLNFRHQELAGERRTVRDIDASKAIVVTELLAQPRGFYELEITSGIYQKERCFVLVQSDESTSLELALQRKEPREPDEPAPTGEIRISRDLTPRRTIDLIRALATDDSFRSTLERNPQEALARFDISIPRESIPAEIRLPPKEDFRAAFDAASLGNDLVLPAPSAQSPVFWVFLVFAAFFAFFGAGIAASSTE